MILLFIRIGEWYKISDQKCRNSSKHCEDEECLIPQRITDKTTDRSQSIGTAPLLAGFAAAFVVGCLACKFMINIVKRGKLNWFAIYCTLVGGLAIIRYFVIQ